MAKLFTNFWYKIFFICFSVSLLKYTELSFAAASGKESSEELVAWSVSDEEFVLAPPSLTLVDSKPIGLGGFGRVYAAKNTENKSIAYKVVSIREGDIHNLLRDIRPLFLSHPTIIECYGCIPVLFAPQREFCSAYERMETDLSRIIIETKQEITSEHVKFFITQILSGLAYLELNGIVHGDLKLKNIFINGDCTIKIGDFGTSYTMASPSASDHGITTPYYRSPEHAIGAFLEPESLRKRFDTKIDVWAAGVIFAETMLRDYLFPAETDIELLTKIVKFLDKYAERSYTEDILCDEDEKSLEFLRKTEILAKIQDKWKTSDAGFAKFVKKFKIDDRQAYEVLIALLQPNPKHRMLASEILRMPYFAEYASEAWLKPQGLTLAKKKQHKKFDEFVEASRTYNDEIFPTCTKKYGYPYTPAE